MSFFNKIKNVFSKFSQKDVNVLDLEDAFVQADFGIHLAAKLSEKLKNSKDVLGDLKKEIEDIMSSLVFDLEEILDSKQRPFVVVLCGVNGSGKTTTVAKLANFLKEKGKTVDIAACDTFRVAATEQLSAWADKLNCEIFKDDAKREPASLAFEALQKTKADFLIVDTAGRLHNNTNLMNELSKIYRVLKKIDDSKPDMNILVLDATTGQNVIEQVREFQKVYPLSGIIISKMDGGSKGGTIVRIAEEFRIPIVAVGTGEKETDIEKFSIEKFLKDVME